ncbi:heme-binding protein A [Actinobacillus equuli]|nr:heme-binding protein A [Actinobacillus equuli]
MNLPKILKSVEKVDEHTVKMTLNQPNSPFLTTVAMDFLSIYSKEYADKLLAEGKSELLDQQPIGTGPFEFQIYQTDQAVRYKANPNYWQGKAKFERLIFAITPDAGTRYAKLKAGECDVIDFPNIADIAQMKQDPKVTLFEREGLNLAYIGLNTQKAALDNVKVRQALQHATDKKRLLMQCSKVAVR